MYNSSIKYKKDRYAGTLKYLTQIKPARNYRNIDSLNNIASYLEDIFKKIGLKTQFQNFLVDGNEYKNVIATLNSKYEKRLIIGAHYDVRGNFQGADDNASAVAGLIQTAKQLYKIKDILHIITPPNKYLMRPLQIRIV